MTAIPFGELQVDSDLQLEVDGVRARLEADGRELTLSTRDAGVLLARFLNALPPQVASPDYLLPDGLPIARGLLRGVLAQLATALDGAGLAARVVDDRGTVLELGHECRSSLARLLLGTERVQLGPVALRVAGTVVRESQVVQRRLGVAAGGAVVAAVLVGAGLRRGRELRGRR